MFDLKEFIAAADGLHAYLLHMIDGLMSAEADTPEAERLRELAEIVEAYEVQRFATDVPD